MTERKFDGWFGVVRWCDEDIVTKLVEMCIPITENNVAAVRRECENNTHFTDQMIEAGWEAIEYVIDGLRDEGNLEEDGCVIEGKGTTYQEFLSKHNDAIDVLSVYNKDGVEIDDIEEIDPDAEVIAFTSNRGWFEVVLDV